MLLATNICELLLERNDFQKSEIGRLYTKIKDSDWQTEMG
jgi:hypothetical protein